MFPEILNTLFIWSIMRCVTSLFHLQWHYQTMKTHEQHKPNHMKVCLVIHQAYTLTLNTRFRVIYLTLRANPPEPPDLDLITKLPLSSFSSLCSASWREKLSCSHLQTQHDNNCLHEDTMRSRRLTHHHFPEDNLPILEKRYWQIRRDGKTRVTTCTYSVIVSIVVLQ